MIREFLAYVWREFERSRCSFSCDAMWVTMKYGIAIAANMPVIIMMNMTTGAADVGDAFFLFI